MDQFKLYLQYQKEVAQAQLKIVDRFLKQERRQPQQRTSNIDIVQHVLNSAGHPLHVSDIIRLAQKNFQVQLNRDSIVSAILKKINAGQTFIRTAPNTFALKTYTSE
jgi:DNA-directed RNA polymerase delta subunit